MNKVPMLLPAAVVLSGALGILEAQQFEGTVKFRTVEVGSSVVQELAGNEEPGPVDAERIFAVPVEQLLGLMESTEGGVDVQETTIQLKGSRMRVDVPDGYVLYDFDAGVFRMVQPSQRAYLEMTGEDLEAMREQAEAMREEAMKDMPPEVREQMKAAENAPQPEVKKLERRETVNGVQATAYDIETPDERVRGWVTEEYAELADAFQAFIKLAEQFAGPEEDSSDPQMLLIDYGVPVRTQTLDPMSADYEVTDLILVRQESLSDDVFEIPSEYTRRTFPGMPGL